MLLARIERQGILTSYLILDEDRNILAASKKKKKAAQSLSPPFLVSPCMDIRIFHVCLFCIPQLYDELTCGKNLFDISFELLYT